MLKKNLLYVLILHLCLATHASHTGIFIIVHGTWGRDSQWCKPGGDFFDALEKSAARYNKKVTSYIWPGYLNHEGRQMAAKGLAKLIQTYPVAMNITLVAHSHGGNVCMVASQLLNQDPHNKHSIDALYAIGTPINADWYCPNMNIIKRVYNLFSFADMVQPVMGIFRRTLPSGPAIANIRLILDAQEPGHTELCTALTARWLPCMHQYLADANIGNFQYFDFSSPGIIFLNSNTNPFYAIDSQRDALMAQDKVIIDSITHSLVRKKQIKQ